MNEFATAEVEGTASDHDLDQRDVRALTEKMTVSPDIGQARGANDLFVVTTESGHSYTVDVRHGMCGCPDAEHRDPKGGCKHVRRAQFATGDRPLPAWVSLDAVDEQLGQHCDGPVATDGGTEIIVAGDEGAVIDADEDGDEDDAEIYTYHWEPEAQGGRRYVRCECCGAECIPADPDRLLHRAGCPEGDRR